MTAFKIRGCRDVRFWHKADVTRARRGVRFREKADRVFAKDSEMIDRE
jgi:hypothetical protein